MTEIWYYFECRKCGAVIKIPEEQALETWLQECDKKQGGCGAKKQKDETLFDFLWRK